MSEQPEQVREDVPYVDPNSGASPQPGGYALGAVMSEGYKEPKVSDSDPILDVLSQTQAIDPTNQPGNPDASYEVPSADDDAPLSTDGQGSQQGEVPTEDNPRQRKSQTDSSSDLGSDVESTEEPAGNASAEEWRQYAVSVKNADEDEVADLKRDELREQYGSK